MIPSFLLTFRSSSLLSPLPLAERPSERVCVEREEGMMPALSFLWKKKKKRSSEWPSFLLRPSEGPRDRPRPSSVNERRVWLDTKGGKAALRPISVYADRPTFFFLREEEKRNLIGTKDSRRRRKENQKLFNFLTGAILSYNHSHFTLLKAQILIGVHEDGSTSGLTD